MTTELGRAPAGGRTSVLHRIDSGAPKTLPPLNRETDRSGQISTTTALITFSREIANR